MLDAGFITSFKYPKFLTLSLYIYIYILFFAAKRQINERTKEIRGTWQKVIGAKKQY